MNQWALICVICTLFHYASAQETNNSAISLPSRFVFSPSFLFRTDYKSQTSTTNSDWSLLDFRLGYQSQDKWYLGILFSYDRETITATNYPISGLNTNYEYIRSHYALSGGYNWRGYYAIVNLIFLGDWTARENGIEKKYHQGIGYQIDLGIHFALFEHVFIGPRITFRETWYSKVIGSNGDTSIDPLLKKTNFDPYFVLWFEF